MGTVAFNDRPFAERFTYMGDTAEASVINAHDGKVVRFGLERPPFGLKGMPVELRGAPDFLGGKFFFEACGVGRDQIVKIKKYKHEAQLWWNELHPVIYHVYDPVNKRWVEIEVAEVQRLIEEGLAPLERFATDRVEYYALSMELAVANSRDGGPTQ
jgi:hypothetical protein